MRSLARTEISSKQSVGDDRRALRRNTFFVEGKGSEAWTVLLARVGDDVYQIAAITQLRSLSSVRNDMPAKFASMPSTRSSSMGCPTDS